MRGCGPRPAGRRAEDVCRDFVVSITGQGIRQMGVSSATQAFRYGISRLRKVSWVGLNAFCKSRRFFLSGERES